MPKFMQKLVFFIEQTEKSTTDGNFSGRASTIANLYMNRFTIEEDAGHEIVNIYGVKEYRSDYRFQTYEEREQKGMSRTIFFLGGFFIFHCAHFCWEFVILKSLL